MVEPAAFSRCVDSTQCKVSRESPRRLITAVCCTARLPTSDPLSSWRQHLEDATPTAAPSARRAAHDQALGLDTHLCGLIIPGLGSVTQDSGLHLSAPRGAAIIVTDCWTRANLRALVKEIHIREAIRQTRSMCRYGLMPQLYSLTLITADATIVQSYSYYNADAKIV
ncbi:hypothetical protein RRG08_033269 [Elysia crispata]|uniref:Uncharacterized protein n=1 Tax=Elysia crispata TaxID=231223 RepID=A0AAE0XRA4_9GAST|nr:hypothetical protein RRG08_033269 [Elysia crispata]